jgi:hypothetical protein
LNTYRLLRPVTVRGVLHQKGAIVALDDRIATWLAEQGAISKQGIVARPAASLVKPARPVGGCVGCGR